MAAPSGADRGGDGGPVDRKADMRRVVDLLVRGIRATSAPKAVPAPRGPAPVDPDWVMSRDGVIGAPLVAEESGPAGPLP